MHRLLLIESVDEELSVKSMGLGLPNVRWKDVEVL